MKRLLSILCTLCLILTLVPGAHAAKATPLPISDDALMEAVGGGSLEEFKANAKKLFQESTKARMGLPLLMNTLPEEHKAYQQLVKMGILTQGNDIKPKVAVATMEAAEGRLADFHENAVKYYYMHHEMPEQQAKLLRSVCSVSPYRMREKILSSVKAFEECKKLELQNREIKGTGPEGYPDLDVSQFLHYDYGLDWYNTSGEMMAMLDEALTLFPIWYLDSENYFPIGKRYEETGKTTVTPSTAGSLYEDSGSSTQSGPVILGVCGGVVVGMGLMYLINKKKNVKA